MYKYVFTLAFTLVACDGSGTATPTDVPTPTDVEPSIDIIGNYNNNFGGQLSVTDTTVVDTFDGSDSVYAITQFDNDAMWLVGQNDTANAFNPDLWSRFDWTFVGSDLYYCQAGFAEASEQAAIDLPLSDATDPTTGGCGGTFPWTPLTPSAE